MKFEHIQQFFFFGLLLVTTATFFWVLGPYLFPVFWAVVIAIVFYPLHLRIVAFARGYTSFATLATIMAVLVTVLLPVFIIGSLIVEESLTLYQSLTAETEEITDLGLFTQLENITRYLEPFGVSQSVLDERFREFLVGISQTVSSSAVAFGQGAFSLFIAVTVMLYLLFFFLRDTDWWLDTLIYYLPIGNTYERRLFKRFSETARAVMKGTLAIAALQGLLGGILFWAVGVPNPVLWGSAMALLAIIPALGPAFIWFPVSVFLMLTGSLWEGIIILVTGIVLISLIDEFLRPMLVGRGAKMPDSIILLATIGGITTFGISGFVVGPIIAAFFLSLWVIFGEMYQKELEQN